MFILTFAFCAHLTTVSAQSTQNDSIGLPGDQFSLQGALELFRKAASPEEFEKLLNAENNDRIVSEIDRIKSIVDYH